MNHRGDRDGDMFLKKNQNAPRGSEHPPVFLLLVVESEKRRRTTSQTVKLENLTILP